MVETDNVKYQTMYMVMVRGGGMNLPLKLIVLLKQVN